MRIERFLDRLQDLGVGLLQLELDVDFVVAAGLVGQVALPAVDVHRRRQRPRARRRRQDLAPLAQQHVLERREQRLVEEFCVMPQPAERPQLNQSF